jgi:phospholipid transport system substrate-binding protein
MRGMLRAILGVAVVAGLMGFRPALAADAQQFIGKLGQETVSILGDKSLSPTARHQRLERILQQSFDLPLLSKLALGRPYRELDARQKQTYQGLFEKYLVSTYGSKFDDYGGQTLEVTGSEKASEGDEIVHSRIIQPKGQPVKVDWRIRPENGKPQIIDVVVAGVSLVVTQRNEFTSLVQQKGIDGFLDTLRQRAGQARTG